MMLQSIFYLLQSIFYLLLLLSIVILFWIWANGQKIIFTGFMVFIGMFGGETKTGWGNRLKRKWKEKHIFQNQRGECSLFFFAFLFFISNFKISPFYS